MRCLSTENKRYHARSIEEWIKKILFGETVKMEKVPCVREIPQAIETRKDKEMIIFPRFWNVNDPVC